jgi:hypothetical protein
MFGKLSSDGMSKEWYPGELTPHFYYINEELRGMATALTRKQGTDQKWEAFDMKKRNSEDTGPLLLGEHGTVELAKQQIERLVK